MYNTYKLILENAGLNKLKQYCRLNIFPESLTIMNLPKGYSLYSISQCSFLELFFSRIIMMDLCLEKLRNNILESILFTSLVTNNLQGFKPFLLREKWSHFIPNRQTNHCSLGSICVNLQNRIAWFQRFPRKCLSCEKPRLYGRTVFR